jgi:transposase InsO family protein
MQAKPTTLDAEVPAKAARRRFSAGEKARILEEYELASPVERAAIGRRERKADRRSSISLLPRIQSASFTASEQICPGIWSVLGEYDVSRAAIKNEEVRERRRIARHPEYRKPELLATGPRQSLSWDITKIRGLHPGEWFSLLVMLDIFSRFVVGWMLVRRANAELAKHFIGQTLQREGIEPGQAIVHADRGRPSPGACSFGTQLILRCRR